MLNAHQSYASARQGAGSAGAVNDSRPVDLVHLSRQTLGNRELEREVLKLFCKQSSIYLDRLCAATSLNDWHEAAHTIKGSARGIGAWAVVKYAEKAEQLKSLRPAKRKAGLVDKLAATLDDTNGFIDELLGEEQPLELAG